MGVPYGVAQEGNALLEAELWAEPAVELMTKQMTSLGSKPLDRYSILEATHLSAQPSPAPVEPTAPVANVTAAAAEAAAPGPPRWRGGDSVVLHSLVGAVQVLNGATGVVERYLEGEQSYVVRMRRDDVLVPVKASNLKGAEAATPAAAAAAAAPWRDGMVTVEGWNGLV